MPFFSATFAFKVCKNHKFNLDIKKDFDADFESHEKVLYTEKYCRVLTYITVCKRFRPITFLGQFSPLFSMDSNSASNLCRIFEELFLLILALFITFNAKIWRNGSKKRKKDFFKMYLRIPFYTFVREVPFCQKKSKSLYPTVHCARIWV